MLYAGISNATTLVRTRKFLCFTVTYTSKSTFEDVASSSSIQKFLDDQFKARDETIAQLQKELDSYKKKFESLQNNMSPDQPINNRNYDPKKANELKSAINKVIDDMLLTNSKLIELEDGSNNTNNSSINHATPHMNNINNIIDQANVDSSFVNPQNRPSDDNELINEGKSDRLTSNSNYTVFIAWTGSMTQEGLKSLFDNDEVLDIRFLPNKQFAHVDLKNEAALTKALKLNGETKSQEQGKLRVEQGKPRSNSSTEGKEPAGSPKQWHNFRNSSMSPPGTIPTVYPNQLDN
ncbi:41911_t:CDS:10 [Gigaspora margarita]|uniref:41911_t:CDS:1 n=1 Tax=Gigaspora margarita TaxID=4874 RepID=A0ABN7UFQ0_GIGMA|nr:41911_t:CDS:10 [Gigaspora margarita]